VRHWLVEAIAMTHEDGTTKKSQFLRGVDFLGDLLDEPGLALLGLVGVLLFFAVNGAVALVQEAFFGGPPQGPGLGG
jgi:hypothetical protein